MAADGGACIICLDTSPPPIQSGCACRGDSGLAHIACLVQAAASQQAQRGNGVWRECQTCKHYYTGAMRAAKFESGSPLYAASGLLTYGAAGKMEDAIRTLVEDGLASSVHYKELYLPASETAGLSSEQSALVDFLVLSRASSFVGFGSSTFSFYLREHRALVGGLPRSSSILVDASAIGTDALFNAAGRVV